MYKKTQGRTWIESTDVYFNKKRATIDYFTGEVQCATGVEVGRGRGGPLPGTCTLPVLYFVFYLLLYDSAR